MIVLIDNYDGFSYNIYQMIGEIRTDIKIIKNDELNISQIKELNPSHIIISSGSGRPSNAGICLKAVDAFKGIVPILGIGLGHLAICEYFGSRIINAKKVVSGIKDTIQIASGSPIFKGLPPVLEVARYHCLAVDRATLSEELLVIAEDDLGEVMGVKHKDYEIYGIQFTPESIFTQNGNIIFENFLKRGETL